MLHSRLLADNVQLASAQRVLILNSAADPFVSTAAQNNAFITLAEDNVAALHVAQSVIAQLAGAEKSRLRHVAFHQYTLHEPPATMDTAVMNLCYQPGNAWVFYGLQLAAYALKSGGQLYVVGAKERGILSVAKRIQELFGNVETLAISKGQRVLHAYTMHPQGTHGLWERPQLLHSLVPAGFAKGKLDEGTAMLLQTLEVYQTDEALDLGCGAGFIGIHVARQASKGSVIMVDASLATVDATQRTVEQSGLTNIRVLPSDGTQAVLSQRFDLVVTNPPFHLGGIQTTTTAERFMREAAQVLRPRGRFYLVANRFLKYEPTLRACFKTVEEVGGNTRYKVLRALIWAT